MSSLSTDRLYGVTASVAVKAPVRTVATSALTLSGLQTVNGVTLTEGERILVTAQADSTTNGIYQASSSGWTRAADFDGARDVVQGTLVLVVGTGSSAEIYELTSANPIIIGTTALVFALRYGANVRYDRTAGEIAASATPVNYQYEPGWANRFATNTTPGTTDMQLALQAAIDSADLTYPKVRITHQNAISKPLLIRSTTVENIAIEGEARTISIIEPTADDIKQAAQNVNCLIFNQLDNGHLHLSHLRFFSDVAYTGYIMYATEGLGADASGQASFSMVLDDIWCSLSSQNQGYFVGGFANLKASNMVYESCKTACWLLQGAGNADQIYINHQLFICFDAFMLASDANDKAQISVIGLNAYNHLRGRLIEFNKGKGIKFSQILLEPDASNLGDVGLFKFTDCENIEVVNFSMAARTGVPAGAVGIDIINGFSGKFVNGVINATTGLKFSGTGALDAEFVNVDFTSCTTCVDFNAPAGTLTGKVKFVNCKLNDAQLRCLVHTTGTINVDIEIFGGEVLNAGLGGSGASRNIDITISGGSLRAYGVRIGQNNGSAAATHYVSQAGTGVCKFIDPVIVGAPPTGLTDTGSAVQFVFSRGDGGSITAAATITLPFEGDFFTVTGNTNITSVVAPGNRGRRVTLMFTGTPTFTDGSNLKLSANLVATADDTITVVCDGTNWYETGRSVN